MENAKLNEMVTDFVKKEFARLGSKNTLQVESTEECPWLLSDHTNWNFTVVAKAMKTVFRVEPALTREGGSIPVAVDIQQAAGKDVMLVPIG
ncbi:MAG: hypothetical protein Q9187_004968 [Circinaria calcarea]